MNGKSSKKIKYKKNHTDDQIVIKDLEIKAPSVLMVGNGINRLFCNNISWSQLIDKTKTDHIYVPRDLPEPLKAQVFCNLEGQNNSDSTDSDSSEKHYTNALNEVCREWCAESLCYEKKNFINELLDSKSFESVLTLNYSYEIEKSLFNDFGVNFKVDTGDKPNLSFNLFKKYRRFTVQHVSSLNNKDKALRTFFAKKEINSDKLCFPYIWHIHGEAAQPRSLVLNYHYYGNMISLIQQYQRIFLRRFFSFLTNRKDAQIGYYPQSWLDYFYVGDVFIVGARLNIDEFDLWWLIDSRLRLQSEIKKRIPKNIGEEIKLGTVYFFDICDDDSEAQKKECMCKSLSVKYKNFYKSNCLYLSMYREIIEFIKSQRYLNQEEYNQLNDK